jgi:hypothetical protein
LQRALLRAIEGDAALARDRTKRRDQIAEDISEARSME